MEDLARLQDLFRDRHVALLIVHHSRKDAADDFLASVSGTYGITGSVDTIVVIKRKRLEVFGVILATGRDIPEAELAVRFDGMTWHEAPESLPEASFERAEVYRIVAELGPIFPAAIAERTGQSRQSVQKLVGKLVDQGAVVRRLGGYEALARAHVSPVSPVSLSEHGESNHSNQGHVREETGSLPHTCHGCHDPIEDLADGFLDDATSTFWHRLHWDQQRGASS